jgi:hypothetical protein
VPRAAASFLARLGRSSSDAVGRIGLGRELKNVGLESFPKSALGPVSSRRLLRAAFPECADTVEKLDFLPRSQFLRQQAGFEKKTVRVRQKG